MWQWVMESCCPGCKALGHAHFCQDCLNQLVRHTRSMCRQCGRWLWPSSAPGEGRSLCSKCEDPPPAYDSCAAPYLYCGPLAQAILALKFQRQFAWIHAAALLITTQVPRPPVQALVPVPLHTWRLMRRGYNQALLLALALGQYWELPIASHHLQRHWARPQVGLSGRDRRSRLHGLFYVTPQRRLPALPKAVALVDDVITTGSTLHAAAMALKQAGCTEVQAICLARAL